MRATCRCVIREVRMPGSRYNHVPEPFDEDAAIEWSPVWSLSEGRFKYLPTELLYPGYPTPEGGRRYCYADSSGGSSGNTLEEAILQGFFELVERDAVAIWWYNRIRRPALDLDSFDEPFIQELRRQYVALGRDLWVLDLTADLPIPTFAAISRRVEGPGEDLVHGFGAHIDPRVAVLRALTEVGQWLLASPPAVATSAGRGTLDPADDPDALAWRQTATVAERIQPVVMVEERHELAAGELQSVVRGCHDPAVPVATLEDDSRIGGGGPLEHPRDPGLHRAVVDEAVLPVGIGLVLDRAEQATEIFRWRVEDRRHDRNCRRRG
jgi:thiazole/oxazole-forming peptide maturase SagD family component